VWFPFSQKRPSEIEAHNSCVFLAAGSSLNYEIVQNTPLSTFLAAQLHYGCYAALDYDQIGAVSHILIPMKIAHHYRIFAQAIRFCTPIAAAPL